MDQASFVGDRGWRPVERENTDRAYYHGHLTGLLGTENTPDRASQVGHSKGPYGTETTSDGAFSSDPGLKAPTTRNSAGPSARNRSIPAGGALTPLQSAARKYREAKHTLEDMDTENGEQTGYNPGPFRAEMTRMKDQIKIEMRDLKDTHTTTDVWRMVHPDLTFKEVETFWAKRKIH